MSWEVLIPSLAVGFFVYGLQGSYVRRSLERITKDDSWASSSDDYSKLIRQDIGGIFLMLAITNGLLATIVALLALG